METDKIIHIKLLIISVIAVIGIEITFDILMSNSQLHPMVILGIKRIIQTALIVLIIFTWDERLFPAIGIKPSLMLYGLKRGIIWSIAFAALVAVAFVILLILGNDPLTLVHSSLPQKKADLILYFIVGGFLAPIAEEIFFRGIIFGFFRRWGAAIGISLSAFLFASTHFFVSGAFIIQFIGGVLFAASYEREKNIVVPITIHMLGNLSIFTLSL